MKGVKRMTLCFMSTAGHLRASCGGQQRGGARIQIFQSPSDQFRFLVHVMRGGGTEQQRAFCCCIEWTPSVSRA